MNNFNVLEKEIIAIKLRYIVKCYGDFDYKHMVVIISDREDEAVCGFKNIYSPTTTILSLAFIGNPYKHDNNSLYKIGRDFQDAT